MGASAFVTKSTAAVVAADNDGDKAGEEGGSEPTVGTGADTDDVGKALTLGINGDTAGTGAERAFVMDGDEVVRSCC